VSEAETIERRAERKPHQSRQAIIDDLKIIR
jgi:hypothetical protein